MILSSLALLAQLAAAQPNPPVLTFPEPGLDDSAAYQGYETRLYRDAARNTVQIYLDGREGRVVHLWADALNESLGFTARGADGRPAPLHWRAADAPVGRSGHWRTLEHDLVADARTVRIGLVLLGSMRVERDLQYSGRQRAPLGERPFRVAEVDRMLAALEKLPPAERRSQLALLHAPDMRALYARLEPTVTIRQGTSRWVARFAQPSLDARDSLALEIVVDPQTVQATRDGRTLSLRARAGERVPFTVRVATTGAPLTPLAREEIFTPEFLAFLASAQADATRARWLEREVRGVELLSSREKLMAGLPTYATYFGRDMMVSALMMRSIWRPAMSEAVIGSVLRKLGPAGDVSHEEALGGQAIREAADEYARILTARDSATRRGDRAASDSLFARASRVLRDAARTRENYHMIDDEFHLPVLAARWITDSSVSAEHKRAFLLDSSDGGGTRAARLLKELALVARMTAPYARDPRAENLVSFAPRDTGWASQSWRDSGDGYANGRWPMDVNAIWAPHALEALGRIVAACRTLGIPLDVRDEPLAAYVRDPGTLGAAVGAWRGAARHFVVRLSPAEVRTHVTARLAAMPTEERAWWTSRLAATGADRDSLEFLALALDARGGPIGVANTDPATGLFLGGESDAAALRDARLFVRPYPVGLLVDGVGPVVANDAYATPPVWAAFARDAYHGPRVVWGREVNLFLLGAARHVAAQPDSSGAVARELRDAARRVRDAVAASGFHSELWSYGFERGRPVPRRYGSGADVQLWSTTDLAVQFALWHIKL